VNDGSPATAVLDRKTGEEITGIGFQTRTGWLVAPGDFEFVTRRDPDPPRTGRGRPPGLKHQPKWHV